VPLPHPDAFTELKNRLISSDEWIWLFEITSPTGGALLGPKGEEFVPRVTPHTVPVIYGTLSSGEPKEWMPWPCRLEEWSQDSKGNVNEMRVVFANILATANQLLVLNDYLRNHKVIVRVTHVTLLDQPQAHFTMRMTVVEATVSWEAVALTLSAFAFMDFSVPQQLVTPICPWKYRGKGCAFIGDPASTLGDCAKSIEACRLRGAWELANGLPKLHPKNFGGFLGVAKGPVPVPQA